MISSLCKNPCSCVSLICAPLCECIILQYHICLTVCQISGSANIYLPFNIKLVAENKGVQIPPQANKAESLGVGPRYHTSLKSSTGVWEPPLRRMTSHNAQVEVGHSSGAEGWGKGWELTQAEPLIDNLLSNSCNCPIEHSLSEELANESCYY